ncbi:MAG TPA: Rrf2 family transcriptional regulator [Sphingobium sp.]|nr:Rrf2 family transcriptional regulator [Sphingobium sp.]
MRLTRYTDYAMRVLIYLATRPDQLCSIAEITRAYGVSQSHLMKVVNDLVNAGYLTSVRGRFGGIRLARDSREINVGAVVRHTEDSFDLVDCAGCVIAPACGLTGALDEALAAFLAVLDGYSLHDLMAHRRSVAALLGIGERAPPTVPGEGNASAATPMS